MFDVAKQTRLKSGKAARGVAILIMERAEQVLLYYLEKGAGAQELGACFRV